MTSTVYFTPDMLNSYERTMDFLKGKEANKTLVRQVVAASKIPHANWLGRWQVIPRLALVPFFGAYAIFVQAIANILYYSGFKRAGLTLDIHAHLFEFDNSIIGYLWYGKDFLALSYSSYSTSSVDLYMMPEMISDEIPNHRLRDSTFWDHNLKLQFHQNIGCCRGQVLWFLRAYSLTRHLIDNPRAHIQAIGSLFSHGADPRPSLIHKLRLKEEALEFKVGQMISVPTQETLVDTLKNLKEGTYLLYVPGHALAYIVTEQGERFLFDPNDGTKAIVNEDSWHTLTHEIGLYQQGKAQAEKEGRAFYENYKFDSFVKIFELTFID